MNLRKAHLILPLLIVVMIVCVPVGLVEWNHHRTYGHFVSYGLHLDPVNRDAYIGIPGQTKMYSATLSNYSLRSVTCNDSTRHQIRGKTVVDASGEWFCRPVPLSMINTQLVSRTLAPGASVEIMNGEATGARDAFRQGDLARFVVFTKLDKSGDWTTAIASVPFVIEDNVVRDDATPFRVKH